MKIKMIIAGIFFSSAGSSFAFDECGYVVHKPKAVFQKLWDDLPQIAISIFPLNMEFAAGPHRLLRGESVVGSLTFLKDDITGREELLVYDASERLLAQVHEKVVACPIATPRGLCKTVIIRTLRDFSLETDPFVLVYHPFRSVEFWYYGEPVDPAHFTQQFADAYQWLLGVLDQGSPGAPMVFASPYERLHYRLATDPLISPYLYTFNLFHMPDGRLHIGGIVPSRAVYYAVLDHVRAVGYQLIDPALVIDTRMFIVDMRPRLYRCE